MNHNRLSRLLPVALPVCSVCKGSKRERVEYQLKDGSTGKFDRSCVECGGTGTEQRKQRRR